MAKVVLNGCFGGFSLSKEAVLKILERKGIEIARVEEDKYGSFKIYDTNGNYYSSHPDFEREDTDLVAVVEELEDEANGSYAKLCIEEYDDENFTYWIDEYDGNENLMLEPVVSEKRLAECKTTKEIVEYLESLNINVKSA